MLLEHLVGIDRSDVLLRGERELLQRDEVRVLSLEEQLEHLAANRRVGYWVTLFAAGVRLLFLGGAAIAMLVLAVQEKSVPLALGSAALLALTMWLGRPLPSRLRELGTTLPTRRELGLDGARLVR
jgi:hypothetical protein